jgi:hypothetical protein
MGTVAEREKVLGHLLEIPKPVVIHGFKPPYERNGIYSIEAVLNHVGAHEREYGGDFINMNSARYHVFKKSCVCVSCGIIGVFFAKERFGQFVRTQPCLKWMAASKRWHFNLYAINAYGHEVLMTKDHIIPASRGGENHQSNYQTMCFVCNKDKGTKMPDELEIAIPCPS